MKIKKSFLFAILTIVAGLTTSGINNMYVQRKGDNGWIFHIFNQKLGSYPNQPSVAKNINYDYTFLESSDSINMLSTVILPVGTSVASINIVSCGVCEEFSPEIIYVKPKGKMALEYRFKISFPFKLWDDIYNCTNPFTINYNIKTNREKNTLVFGYTPSKWKSNREKMLAIIQVIKYNTGKL